MCAIIQVSFCKLQSIKKSAFSIQVAGLAAGLALGGKDLTSPATKKLLRPLAASRRIFHYGFNFAQAASGG